MKIVKESECSSCNKIFPQYKMRQITVTNSYGDKQQKAWICYQCWIKSRKRRSNALLIVGIIFVLAGLLLLLAIPGLLELQFYNHYYSDLPSEPTPYISLSLIQMVIGLFLVIFWKIEKSRTDFG